MTRQLDRDVVLAYVDEARGYLPIIKSNLEQFQNDDKDLGLLEEAHRHIHTIKGASSMVGFALLSHMAYLVEDTIEEIAAGQMTLNDEVAKAIFFTLGQIEAYLEGVASDNLQEEPLLRSVTQTFRRLRGLPETGDEKVIQAILANQPVDIAHPERSANLPEPSASISMDLRDTFRLEAEENLDDIANCLIRLGKSPENRGDLQAIRRRMHTLKGSAGLVGFDEITQLAHRSEDLLEYLFDREEVFQESHLHLLQDTADILGDLTHEHPVRPKTSSRLQELYRRYDLVLKSPSVSDAAFPAPSPQEQPLATKPDPDPKLEKTQPSEAASPIKSPVGMHSELLRIPQKRIDDLVTTVSDLMIHRTTFEQTLRRLTSQMDELKPSIRRLQRIASSIEREYEVALLDAGRAVRGVSASAGTDVAVAEFDALEMDRYTEFHLLARDLAETSHDLQTVTSSVGEVVGDFEGYLLRSSRLTSEAQDQLMKMRMVPLSTLMVRLERAVRVTAKQSQKKVDFRVEGEGIELDKTVLEEMADPLVHILRNAVDHGIEPPHVRKVLGKDPTGHITLKAYHSGTQVILEINDDGAGMALDQLRMKAIAGGFISQTEAENLNDEAIYDFVFKPGFSTAGQVSEVSGRGVGLDIVKAVVQKLKGQLQLSNRPNAGMSLVIRLPLTLAILKVILVQSGGEVYAIPMSGISQIIQPDQNAIERHDHPGLLHHEGKFLPLRDLAESLGMSPVRPDTDKIRPVLLIDLGTSRIGMTVDRLLEAREIVIKNLGRHLTHVQGITGATLMGDGSVVLILNPADLVKPKVEGTSSKNMLEPATNLHQIMVVDDSVSVRKVLTQLLSHAGYDTLAAKDGLEALEMLQRLPQNPAALILDIEMPRMDGYELTSLLRGQPRFSEMPIIILTSRGAARHRERAENLGVTEYLVKPFREEVLLNLLQVHTGKGL